MNDPHSNTGYPLDSEGSDDRIIRGFEALTAGAARVLTDRIKSAAEDLWALLLEAHERQAWRALGYSSWRTYAMSEFGMSQSYAYRLLDQGRVMREIEAAAGSPMGEIVTEREARDIKPHLVEVTEQIRERVADEPERAKEIVDEVVTETRERVKPRPKPRPKPEVSPEEHERRTAIAALVSSVEVLGRGDLAPQELRGALDAMQRDRIGRALESAQTWLAALHAEWDANEGTHDA
jgi:hypothetical protein